MTLEVAFIMFILFMVAIYANYRHGFQRGAYGGHLVGVHETVEFLVENGSLSATNAGKDRTATKEELIEHILVVLHERRLKKLKELQA